jgi:molybdenum cofactor synthesis domain-containing protein
MNETRAAIVIIGNEILSGKTQDINVKFIASELSEMGIVLSEVRMIPDIENSIIQTINELKEKYKYIFTTGGIGPTHDDITSSSIAKAMNLKIEYNKEALEIIAARCKAMGRELLETTKRMAMMPIGAEILKNSATGAPGFRIGNIFVMAGIPEVMQAIFQEAKKNILSDYTPQPIFTKTLEVFLGESIIATPLLELQSKYPSIIMGSYPFRKGEIWGTNLEMRSKDQNLIEQAMTELKTIIGSIEK